MQTFHINDAKTKKTLKAQLSDQGVVGIELCRSNHSNNMNEQFWNEFPDIIHAINREAAARVILVSAVGTHFNAGMDKEGLSACSAPI